VVGKHFGQLCLVLAALTQAPLAMSVLFGDTAVSLRYGIVVCGIAALGAALTRLRAPSGMQPNEGMVLAALMFLFIPLVMSYTMMGSGSGFLGAVLRVSAGPPAAPLAQRVARPSRPALPSPSFPQAFPLQQGTRHLFPGQLVSQAPGVRLHTAVAFALRLCLRRRVPLARPVSRP
jgi:hypothetical protein